MKRQPSEAETRVIGVRHVLEKSPGGRSGARGRVGLGQKPGHSGSISGNGQEGDIALPGGTDSEFRIDCVVEFMKPHAGNTGREHNVARVARVRRVGCAASWHHSLGK